DLRVQGRDLVVATQGRAFWVLDDISPLRQLSRRIETADAHLFAPETACRFEIGGGNGGEGANPPAGAMIYYSLAEELDLEETSLTLEILNADGTVLRTLETDEELGPEGGGEGVMYRLPAEKGINRIAWDMRRDAVTQIPDVWAVSGGDAQIVPGYTVGPGTYTVRLSEGDNVVGEAELQVQWDPRLEFDAQQITEQQAMAEQIYAMLNELHGSVNALRTVKGQAETRKAVIEKQGGSEALADAGEAVIEAIDAWEQTVITEEREFFQDVLNWPDRIDADLQVLYGAVDDASQGLTKGMRDRFSDLEQDWRGAIQRRDAVIAGPVAAFNALFEEEAEPGLALPPFVDASSD
ncbi:MAG: hypothetical protein AAFS13_07980, partial [Pseudomonadota bacterium]